MWLAKWPWRKHGGTCFECFFGGLLWGPTRITVTTKLPPPETAVKTEGFTPPKSNIDTKKWWFWKCISFQTGLFWVSMLDFRGGSFVDWNWCFFLSKIVKANFGPIFQGRKLTTYSCFQTKSQVVRWSLLFQQYHVNKTKEISLGPNKQTFHTFNSKSHLLKAANQKHLSNKKHKQSCVCTYTLNVYAVHPGFFDEYTLEIWNELYTRNKMSLCKCHFLSTPTIDLFSGGLTSTISWVKSSKIWVRSFPKHESFGFRYTHFGLYIYTCS